MALTRLLYKIYGDFHQTDHVSQKAEEPNPQPYPGPGRVPHYIAVLREHLELAAST
jgi:hypothetical protein